MSGTHDNLDDALRAAAAGNWDALTAQQVAGLESALNNDPALAAQLAGVVPPPDPRLAAGLDLLDRADLPSSVDWQRVWERIEAASARLSQAEPRPARRVLRLWKPLTAGAVGLAAAACLLVAVLWKHGHPPTDAPWPMQLATNVEIDQLEVGEGTTPLVLALGGDNGPEVIWLLPDES